MSRADHGHLLFTLCPSYLQVLPGLQKQHSQVILFDMIGYGLSDKPVRTKIAKFCMEASFYNDDSSLFIPWDQGVTQLGFKVYILKVIDSELFILLNFIFKNYG